MTAHDHREHIDGCYRCDLSRDEQWQQYDANLRADNEAAWFQAQAWHMDAHLKAGDEREEEGA